MVMDKKYAIGLATLATFLAGIFLDSDTYFFIAIVVAAFVFWKYGWWKLALLLFLGLFIKVFYSAFLGIAVIGLSVLILVYNYMKQIKLIKKLFFINFGVKAEKVKIISENPSTYDLLQYGITSKAIQVKIWSEKKVFKGFFETENKKLHLR